MQNLRKLDDGFEIDGKKYKFNEVNSLKYLRSSIQHIGTVHAKVANDELQIFLRGAYSPIKISSLSKVYVAYFSEKSSKTKSEVIKDFHDHIFNATVDSIYQDYETRLLSSSGLQYDCLTIYSTGDFVYDGGSFNIKRNPPKFYFSYPLIEFEVGFGSSITKGIGRALLGNLTSNLQVDITSDTNIFLHLFEKYFGYKFN